jgi:hypothetical protein
MTNQTIIFIGIPMQVKLSTPKPVPTPKPPPPAAAPVEEMPPPKMWFLRIRSECKKLKNDRCQVMGKANSSFWLQNSG